MLIEISDGKTNELIMVDDTDLPDVEQVAKFSQPKRKLYKQIEKLSISADAKALLFKMTDTVIKIGKVLLPVGRAILGAALELLKIFPTLTLAVILAQFLPLLVPAWFVKIKLAALISAILPFLGAYSDIKSILMNDKFGEAARNIAKKFYPENSQTKPA